MAGVLLQIEYSDNSWLKLIVFLSTELSSLHVHVTHSQMVYSCLAVLTELTLIGLSSQYQTTIDGDLIIGGLFPVHEQGVDGQPCGRLSEGRGIHRVEAMLFAIDNINRDPDILPGIRLGARILDTCSNPSYALYQSLIFVRDLMRTDTSRYYCSDGSDAKRMDESKPVAGIIGGSYSSVSIQTAHLLRLFNIVQISPASMNPVLSDKTKFNLFARTVPSDLFQVRVMADIARLYNWTYVSMVYSAGEFGELKAEEFKKQAKYLNVCIALEEKIFNIQDIPLIADRIVQAANYTSVGPRVVVMFTRIDDTRQFLRHIAAIAPPNLITWLAADGWEMKSTTTRGVERFAEGALVVTFEVKRVVEFENSFLSLRPDSMVSERNPWFQEIWSEKFNCTFVFEENRPRCHDVLHLTRDTFQADDKVQFVIDAVYALAHALHRMYKTDCNTTVCNKMKIINGSRLYENLMSVSFTNMVGNVVQFDENGDGPANYRVMTYRRNRDTETYDYVEVGNWRSGILTLADKESIWNHTPVSTCSLECPAGFRKKFKEGNTCCWICIE